MLESKPIIIPLLRNENKATLTSSLTLLCFGCENKNELALQHGGFCAM